MANAVAVDLCNTCGHFKENHSARMGCMVQGSCNYSFVHYCTCERFMEIINEPRNKDHEDIGQAL